MSGEAQIKAQDETIRSGMAAGAGPSRAQAGGRRPLNGHVAGGALSFRSRLDDYLTRLMRGELEAAVEAHFAPEGRLFENGVLRAEGAQDVRRKLAPVARRHVMLRGTLDGLECDRFSGAARFLVRFDGVDIDGRILREEVRFRQRWHLGRIVEEHQERRNTAGPAVAAGLTGAREWSPLPLVAGAIAVL